jgi:hypothetical protein
MVCSLFNTAEGDGVMRRKPRFLCILLALLAIAMSVSGCSSEYFGRMFGKSGLVINEVCTSNAACLLDDEFGTPDWIELYNGGSAAVNLKDYALSNDLKSPIKFLMPDISIAPGEYLIVYFSKLESKDPKKKPATGFKLSSAGTMVVFTASGGDTLQKLEVPALSSDQTYALDENGQYRVTASATPGKANTIVETSGKAIAEMPESAPVKVTEILVNNTFSLIDEDGDRGAWVELENSSSSSVSLSNYRLSDDADNPAKWSFPEVSIAAGARILVYCSGKDKVTQSGQLHASFRIGSSDLHLCLFDVSNMQMQKIQLPVGIKDNLSYGVKDGQWLFFGQPTPGKPNTTRGFTLQSEATLFDANGLFISEVGGAQGYKSAALDWVEIHNGGSGSGNLSGYYLSDDKDNLKKAKIGSVSVPAGGYAVLTVSGNPNVKTSDLNFGIGAGGETLILSSPEGVPIDIFPTGVMRPGITSGRIRGDASGTRVFFTSPTRGTANTASYLRGYANKPVFSVPGGVKTEAVSVTIETDTPGARIYYTTDGSVPTAQSKLYTGPLSISTNTPIRAVALADGVFQSDVATSTYLFEKKHTVPVVCLTMNQSEFSKMYANTLTYVTIERPGNFEYYEKDGTPGAVFPAAVRVSGWSTRTYNQKSLTFKLDDAFGMETVTYPFFDNYPIKTFAALTMRAAGQDRSSTYLRDAFFARMALWDEFDADAPNNRYAVLYINGKYWGLYDLREEIGKDMLASHHNVEPTSVNYMRRQVVQYGSNAEWQRIAAYGRSNNLSNPDKYAQFQQWVDVSAWADYLVLRNYFRETDMFNQKYWHTNDFKVKLRPIYFDNDLSLFASGALSSNLIGTYFSFGGYTTGNGTYVNMDVSAALWTSPEFRKLFLERWVFHSKNALAPSRLIQLLDSMVAEMEPEMSRQIARWGAPSSLAHWRSELAEFKSLLQQRPSSAKELVRKNFGLSSTQFADLYK